jgi:4-hydroxybenzoate polyprenyltransferase
VVDVARQSVPDAKRGNWVDTKAPEWMQPYLRLARIDRPIGWWLLVLPCWWSTALAAALKGDAYPDPVLLGLFFIGSIAMRGAGSTYNDIADRELDRQVERTRTRPLASGAVGLKAAWAFCAAQALVGLAVLVSLDDFAIRVGLLSLVPVLAYPFMKRITSWPQAVLGLAFSWGALMGFAELNGTLGVSAYCLYGAAVFWTMGYDTIYAVQDIEDDALAGIKSTARLFGAATPIAVGVFYTVSVILLSAAVITAKAGFFAQLGVAGFAIHLGLQGKKIDMADGRKALKLFRSNRDAGLILFAGLALDVAVRHFGG